MLCPECGKVISPRFPMHECTPEDAPEDAERDYLGFVRWDETQNPDGSLSIKNVEVE